jgi:hypothetical protein
MLSFIEGAKYIRFPKLGSTQINPSTLSKDVVILAKLSVIGAPCWKKVI